VSALALTLALAAPAPAHQCRAALAPSHPLAAPACDVLRPTRGDLRVLRAWLKARDVRDETEHDPAFDLVHAHMREVCQDLEATEIVRDYRTWEAFDRLR
jgi:hypothetical protein